MQKPRTKPAISWEEFTSLKAGDTIFYVLLEKDLPVNPEKEWKGQIVSIHLSTKCLMVSSLEPGFENQIENVKRSQVVRAIRAHSV